jgi:hypothetical protein
MNRYDVIRCLVPPRSAGLGECLATTGGLAHTSATSCALAGVEPPHRTRWHCALNCYPRRALARDMLCAMLAGAIFCITHGRSVNLVHMVFATAPQPAALNTFVAHPEDLAGHPVRPGPALGLLDGYLQLLTSLDEPPSPELAPIIGGHFIS